MLQCDTFLGRNFLKPTENPKKIPAGNASSVAAITPPLAAATNGGGSRPAKGAAPNGDEPRGSMMIIGPKIQVKGVEISACGTLVVEGHVEATLDSRVLQILAEGTFTGTAAIDNAEIRGTFSGELIVRKCLIIHATGKVSGKIRYKKVIIEEGGEICGEIAKLSDSGQHVSARPASLSGTAAAVAA